MPAIADGLAAPLHQVITDGDTIGCGVQLDAGQPYRWLAADGDGDADFRIVARFCGHAAVDEALLTVWDWNNRAVAAQAIAPRGEQAVRFRIEGRGVYLVTLDGLQQGKPRFRIARSFAACPPNDEERQRWATAQFWLGIGAFPGRYHWLPGSQPACPQGLAEQQARDLEASIMARLGLQVARLDVSMVLPEKETSQPDWRRMDAAVAAYTSRGFKLALQLMMPPDWAVDPRFAAVKENLWRYPRREEPYRRYARLLLARYGKHAAFVQVNNEPDQSEFWAGPPQEYVTQFGWAREEIRRLLPEAAIANGGYAFIDQQRTELFVEQLKGRTELQAYHSHGNLAELKRDFILMRRLHQEAGYVRPQFVNTECGYAAWRLDQERTQAMALVQKMLYGWAHGDEGMLLFASRMTRGPGRGGGPGSFTRDFGLLDYQFCPRFAYGAVAAFVHTLAGARFERVLVEDDNLHAYLFGDGRRKCVTLFAVNRPMMLTLRTDAAAAEIRDIMGNATNVANAGRIEINVTPALQTIVLTDATRIEVK